MAKRHYPIKIIEYLSTTGPTSSLTQIDKRSRRSEIVYNDLQYESVKSNWQKSGIYLDEAKPTWKELNKHNFFVRLWYWAGRWIYYPIVGAVGYAIGDYEGVEKIFQWLGRL